MRKRIISMAVVGIFIGAVPVVADQPLTSIIAAGVVQSSIDSAARRNAATATSTYSSAPAPASNGGPRIYAVGSSESYCPSGLQPVTIDGAIGCGTPNQSVSYESMKSHP